MDQTNPWREAISAALFEKQLPPIGESEAPEDALHRLLKAEGEWALMNHKHGEISPYTRNERWEDASTVNAMVKEAMAHPSLTFDPVLARHVGLTGEQVLSRTTALTASQVQAQIEQERIRAVRFDDRHDGITDAMRYGFLNNVPPPSRWSSFLSDPPIRDEAISARSRALASRLSDAHARAVERAAREILNNGNTPVFRASPDGNVTVRPGPPLAPPPPQYGTLPGEPRWPFSSTNDAQTQQVPPQAGDPEHRRVGDDQHNPDTQA